MPLEHSPSRMDGPGSSASGVVMNSEEVFHVNKIAMRTPPFWPTDPELWFIHLEEQFSLSGIVQDSTKFSHVLAQLDLQTSQEVRDLLINPPANDRYQALKTALIKRLTTSQEQRIRRLLEHEELGDRKPSQFLRHLRALAGTTASEELLRSLWLGRLPSQMQAILATRVQDPLDDVAEQADRIREATGYTVAEVVNSAQKQSWIEEQLRQITRQLAELNRRRDSRPFVRGRSNSRARSKENKEQCFYHRKFGEKAKKCVPPCNYQASKEKGGH